MKQFLYFSIIVCALLVSGCSDANPFLEDENNDGDTMTDRPVIDIPEEETHANAWELTTYLELTGAENDAMKRLNVFCGDFIGATASNIDIHNNMAVSPISASVFLALVANSCDDAVARDIYTPMGYNDLETLTSTCSKLMHFLPCEENGNYLLIANGLWSNKKYRIPAEFTAKMLNEFNAEVTSVDFGNREEVSLINKWANDKTHGMIPNIVDYRMVNAETKLFVANAVYFAGEWENKFDKALTTKTKFHGSLTESEAYMMHKSLARSSYGHTDRASIVSIPFNGWMEMDLILPNENMTATEYAANFSGAEYSELQSGMYACKLNLSMPRFEINYETGLSNVFSSMGLDIENIGMAPMNIPGTTSIYPMQKAGIYVDEDGAKLAAVTSSLAGASGNQKELPTINFTLDRPFMFVIRNRIKDLVLMAGTVNNL